MTRGTIKSGNLRDLQETDDRKDITYLANKTGWDARAVAIASLADQFSARTTSADGQVQIAPPSSMLSFVQAFQPMRMPCIS
jgi:hypothetical protein